MIPFLIQPRRRFDFPGTEGGITWTAERLSSLKTPVQPAEWSLW
jgi:hypothetical protein